MTLRHNPWYRPSQQRMLNRKVRQEFLYKINYQCQFFFLPTVPGMCMCLQTWCNHLTGLQYVMAGFDDGSVVLWECRQPTAELTSLKLFSEPGTGVYNSLYVPIFLCMCLI